MPTPQDRAGSAAASTAVPTASTPVPTVSIACPSCRRLVPAGTPCPWCGSPPAGQDVTLVLQAPPVGETAELEPVVTGGPAAHGPAARERAARRRRPGPRALLAGAGALALVAAAAVAGLRAGSHDQLTAVPTHTSPRPPAQVAALPAALVRAAASSTQRPDGGVGYAASNTLDGQPETAWNSDGQGVGVVLVYTFARPVDLRSITVLNGYQKVRGGSRPADLYTLNERVRAFTVTTDAGSATWDLRDDRAPQTLTHAFGTTRTVRLRVAAVYPSRTYTDLAVSEVGFGVAAGG